MATIWKVLTRKKVIDRVSAEETRLSRVLNTFDLTALGVGSTLGVGVYVLAGHVAKDTAGPAVILSFLIAAIASVFAGLCYAEFGARAPRAGSAYIYSYVCVGEFVAFVIGWNLILEYVIGSASVARGLSLYLDTLINNTMQNTFIDIAPIDVPYLSKYFDFFAFGISALLSIALAFGMKESSLVNNIFTVLNIFVVLFVIIAGSLKADPANWDVNPNQVNATNSTNLGNGGFFPFGIEGMIKGAATCFYGFVGFDCIATTGEEVKNPKRAIPISIILSLFIIFLAYFGTSTVITLMVPYYLQNPDAPIPYAFEHIGWNTAKWIVAIGGIFGLCASLFGAMFPLPRIIYAMASDSLVFKFLGKVSPRFQTPVVGTLLAGLLTGLMSALFELKQLVNMMSIGTLLAYTIVAASVLLLRYTDNKIGLNPEEELTSTEDHELLQNASASSVLAQIFNCGRHKDPTNVSESVATVEVFIYCVTCVLIGLSAIYLKHPISNGEIWAIVLTSVAVFIAAVLIMSLVTQPTSKKELSFKVPMVPLIPALSILINIYLMLMLDAHTWIRFAVWMAFGLPIYYISVRPYTEAQNKNVSNKSSIDYNISMVNAMQNGKLNGHTNIAFVSDDDVITKESETDENKTLKKKPAPAPPMKINDADIVEIPSEIARLDEMLEEVSNSINSNAVNRKLSVGTLSNVSDVGSREENVVAVVHRDNVVTPANSNAPPSPCDNKKPFPNDTKVDTKLDDIQVIAENDKTVFLNITQNDIQREAPHSRQNSVDSPVPPETSSSANSLTGDSIASDDEKPNKKQQNEPENNLNIEQPSPTATPPPTPNLSPIIQEEMESRVNPNKNQQNEPESNLNIDQPSPTATPPPSPNLSPIIQEEMESRVAPLPPPLLSSSKVNEDVIVVARPTAENLNSVTLRHVKHKDRSRLPEGKSYEPDDDNLKFGSEKYNSFLASLSGTLQKLSMMPINIPYIKKNVAAEFPTEEEAERKPNENVIEESISTKEAKEKLDSLISDEAKMRAIFGRSNEEVEKAKDVEKQKDDEENQMKDEENKSEKSTNEIHGENSEDITNNDYMNHKQRMQNVFRSINLKKSDSFKEPALEESRNTKSLGPSFSNDDKFKHRQAMSEIFKTIQLRRKDSKKPDDKE